MSTTPELNETQLAEERGKAWRQNGDAVLTLETARAWLNERGLVLFAPRAQQLGAPAPSLVEATLGKANESPTAAETDTARGLVARMVSEGSALPLNLLGGPGDLPDFVVSAQAFPYVFTLRGDKGWKQPPSTSGAVKVSPLSASVYELLAERGALTAAEITTELGRELTETAVARSLGELWSQLRVIPLLSGGEAPTLWELTTRRFTKALKAGANAGQPTALSALLSLYLGQVFAATEEEIATFLSPLTARSRVREVAHALTAGRQLETIVVEGRTLLHVPGALPEIAAAAAEPAADGEEVPFEKPKKIGTGRISSFSAERKGAGDFRGKPVRSFSDKRPAGGRSSGPGGARPASRFAPRADGKTDRERRPFGKSAGAPRAAGVSDRPSFNKPWEEDRKPRPATTGATESFTKFRRPAPEDRKPLGPREQAGLPEEKRTPARKASTSFDRGSRPGAYPKRPYTPREGSAGGAGGFAKRPYTPRGSEGAAGGFAAKRPYTPRAAEGGDRPSPKRPYTPRTGEGAAERGSFKPRSYENRSRPGAGGERSGAGKPGGFVRKPFAQRGAEGETRAPRPYTPRPFTPRGAAEGGARPFPSRPYKPREAGGNDRGPAKRPFTPRVPEGGSEDGGRTIPKRPFKPRAADAGERKYTKAPFDPQTEGGERKPGKRPFTPSGGGSARPGGGARKPFGARPSGGFGARQGSRPSARPGGTFGARPGGKPGGAPPRRPGAGAPRKPRTEE